MKTRRAVSRACCFVALEECPGRGSHLTRVRAFIRDAWGTNRQKTVRLCADQPAPAQLVWRVLNSAAQRGSIRTRGEPV